MTVVLFLAKFKALESLLGNHMSGTNLINYNFYVSVLVAAKQ